MRIPRDSKWRGAVIVPLLLFGLVVVTAGPPTMERAKEEARKSQCLNNLKECAVALQIYWNDYDATLPSSAIVSPNPTQSEVTKFLTAKETWPPTKTTNRVTWYQVLYDHMKSSGIVFCPSDAPRSRVSYWWKYAIDLAWRDSSIKARKEGDYVNPSEQICLYEHAGWHTGDAAGIKNGVIINVAYMDSHVRTVTIVNGPTSYPSLSDERTGLASTRLGEPMYFNYDNSTNTKCSGTANYVDPRRYSDKY